MKNEYRGAILAHKCVIGILALIPLLLATSCSARKEIDTPPHSPADSERPAFNVTSVSFGDAYDKVYIYVANDSETVLTPTRVVLDGRDVTTDLVTPISEIGPGAKLCMIVELNRPLRRGHLAHLVVSCDNGTSAEVARRCFSAFPVGSDGSFVPDDPRLIIQDFSVVQIDEIRAFRNSVSKSSSVTAFNVDSGATADVTDALRTIRKLRIRHLGALSMITLPGENYVALSKEILSEIDVIRVRPALAGGSYTDEFFSRIRQSYPAVPFFVTVPMTKEFVSAEGLRSRAYRSIAAGAKGLFFNKGLNNETYDKRIEEAADLTEEIRFMESLLRIGEACELAKCDGPDMEVSSLLCGDKGVVVFLRRKNKYSGQAQAAVSLKVDMPSWMNTQAVYEVGGSCNKVAFTRQGNEVSFSVNMGWVPKQFVVAADAGDFYLDADGDGWFDAFEISVGPRPGLSDTFRRENLADWTLRKIEGFIGKDASRQPLSASEEAPHFLLAARSIYESLISLYPETQAATKAKFGLACLHQWMNEDDKAIEIFEEVVKQLDGSEMEGPYHPGVEARWRLGRMYLYRGQPERAFEQFRLVPIDNHTRLITDMTVAKYYAYYDENIDEAIDFFSQMSDKHPEKKEYFQKYIEQVLENERKLKANPKLRRSIKILRPKTP